MALSFARPKQSDKKIVQKAKTTVSRKSVRGGGGSVASQIQSIVAIAESKLKHHKDDYILIQEEKDLRQYLEDCKKNGYAALDTETTGLNPLLVDLVGICIYTPNSKAAYIPIGHKSHITGVKFKNQLSLDTVSSLFAEFMEDIKWVFHNAKYDIRVCRHTMNLDFQPYWDAMLAGYCIDENEPHGLKDLHLKYCDSTDTESLKFDTLFNGLTFDQVPISVAYLYAAGDAIKTFELYEYQKTILNRRNGGAFEVFSTIEMPLISVVADMEDRGVCLDFDVCDSLHKKYHEIKEEREQIAQKVISMYEDQIENYKLSHPNCKLSTPVSLTSSKQLAILFYDILKLESPDEKSPRGTGENILKHFAEGKHKDLCNAILNIRNVAKLLNTYIDKMPKVVLEDGRVHADYNQYGAKTGRFSSSDPNLQNIPSHNKEIRQMFKAQDGYVLIGADYSQQEPMVTAHLSNDKKMQDAFIHGKDIYATIASLAFHKPYDECKEFRPDGTVNPAGKERRSQAKSIVLGILYGRQIPSIGEQLGVSTKEAQKIYDSVLKAFPQLAKFIDESQTMAKEKGYVTTAWGRRRHLVDMQLDRYEFTNLNFDPLAFGEDQSNDVPESVKKQYTQKLDKAFGWKRKNDIIQQAYKSGIKIKDNTGFVSQAERQCVNARVQGSAADMVKLAMIHINNDEKMKDLDFHLLLQVHDEVIGECPEKNVVEAKERLSELMKEAPSKLIKLPFRCDCEVTRNWYGEVLDF